MINRFHAANIRVSEQKGKRKKHKDLFDRFVSWNDSFIIEAESRQTITPQR